MNAVQEVINDNEQKIPEWLVMKLMDAARQDHMERSKLYTIEYTLINLVTMRCGKCEDDTNRMESLTMHTIVEQDVKASACPVKLVLNGKITTCCVHKKTPFSLRCQSSECCGPCVLVVNSVTPWMSETHTCGFAKFPPPKRRRPPAPTPEEQVESWCEHTLQHAAALIEQPVWR
jgi:hypothetical protein